tara:strand:- start:404 stop:1138 length:735 start_codon:yes stop_codon:yes gene_type:complete
MRIDSAGKLLVGATSGGTFDMAVIVGTNAVANDLTLKGPDNSQVRINFGDASSDTIGDISYNHSNNSMRFVTNGTERLRITGAGDVLIGVPSITDATSRAFGNAFSGSSAYGNWTSWGSGAHSHAVFRNDTNIVGTITTNASATAYNTSSDYRLKEDLKDFNGLEMVSSIPVYDHKWKVDDSRSYGVMAHELQEVLPQAVSGEKDAEEMQSVDYSKIVPVLLKAIQELTAKVETLEANACKCKN